MAYNDGDIYRKTYCVSDYLDDALEEAAEWARANRDVIVDDVTVRFDDGQWYVTLYWIAGALNSDRRQNQQEAQE